MVKKILKSAIAIIMVLILLLSCGIMTVFAVSQSDLNEIQNNIKETKVKIDQVERNLSSAMKQISSLNAEIANYENEIEDLNSKIADVTNQINDTEVELKKAEEAYSNQENLLRTRIVAMYEAGETSYLDVLLSSKSVTDFISKYYIVNEIAEGDKNLLDKMEQNRNSIEETKAMLVSSKEQIESLKKNKEDTANSLKNSKAMKQSYVDQLSEEESSLNDELEQFEKDKKSIQEELARIARENNGGKDIIPGKPSRIYFPSSRLKHI